MATCLLDSPVRERQFAVIKPRNPPSVKVCLCVWFGRFVAPASIARSRRLSSLEARPCVSLIERISDYRHIRFFQFVPQTFSLSCLPPLVCTAKVVYSCQRPLETLFCTDRDMAKASRSLSLSCLSRVPGWTGVCSPRPRLHRLRY